MKLCDLHTHSVYSDGTWTPAQLLDEAQRIGLSAIALTDHNTVAGLPDFLEAARDREVEAVPGVEFSSAYDGKDVHIVALFIRPEHYAIITAVLADAQQSKEESNRDLAANLRKAGYPVDYDTIKAASCGGVNRAHFAQQLQDLGYVGSVREAFDTLLDPKFGLYHPPKRMTSFETIAFIKSLGAVAVLAHPLLTMDEKMLRQFLPQAVASGLDAMETEYVTYDEETTWLARSIADEFGLMHSGGSDFHGARKPDIRLGIGRGELAVPAHLLDILKQSGTNRGM